MNRTEFMRQLEQLLQNITPSEREEALQYYNDYFDDAGEENEQEVIEALGSPARIAENLKKDLLGSGHDHVQTKAVASDRAIIEYGKAEQDVQGFAGSEGVHEEVAKTAPAKKEIPVWAIALITICVIIASPVLIGLAGALLGVAIAILAVFAAIVISWFAIIFVFAMVALSMFVVLGVLFGVGIECLFIEPVIGVTLIGAGLVCGGVGVLFMMLTVAMAGIVTPAVFKGIGRLFAGKKKEK